MLRWTVWGTGLAAWLGAVVATSVLLFLPYREMFGFESVSAGRMTGALLTFGQYPVDTPVLLQLAILSLCGALGGALLFLLMRVLNPRMALVRASLAWAVCAMKPVAVPMVVLLVGTIVAAAVFPDSGSYALFGGILAHGVLFFACMNPAVLSSPTGAKWWRPRFPPMQVFFLFLLVVAIGVLLDLVGVWASYQGVLETIVVEIAASFVGVIGMSVLAFSLTPNELTQMLLRLGIFTLFCAWFDLTLRMLFLLAAVSAPFVMSYLAVIYILPSLQDSAESLGTTLSPLMTWQGHVWEGMHHGYLTLPILPLACFSWLAVGRLLILLERSGHLVVSKSADRLEPAASAPDAAAHGPLP